MKNKYFSSLTFLIAAFILQFGCSDVGGILNSAQKDSLITKFDAEQMAKMNLPDFILIRSRAQWNRGREFVFQRSKDQANVSVIIGMHQSSSNATSVALDYLNEISMHMNDSPLAGAAIGDKLWWWSPNADTTNVTNILFLKENALFILSSHKYENLIDLARAIDEDIAKKEIYIKRENTLSVPRIDKVTLTKGRVTEGDTIKITIHAADPNNESLEYNARPGLIKFQSDAENMFTLIASREMVSEPFWGPLKIKFIVINQSNVVSGIAEITVNITP